jgi:two-component system, OmpR family, response regulator
LFDLRLTTRSNAVRFTDVEGASPRASLGACRMNLPAARIRVLLVEPHADTRQLYELALTAAGFDVQTARDGTSATVALATSTPSIVVSETRLPDGGDLLTRLANAQVPVIALTTDALYHRHVQAGLCTVLLKPCLPAEVAAAIRAALGLTPQ